MKFSHSLQFNAVPEWSSHYIAYSNLKKIIYSLEKTVHQNQTNTDTESRSLIGIEDPEVVFSHALDVELEKISSFYVAKEGELLDDVAQLLGDVATQNHPLLHGGDHHDGHDSSFDVADHPSRLARVRSNQTDTSRGHDSDDDSDETENETTGLTTGRKGHPHHHHHHLLHHHLHHHQNYPHHAGTATSTDFSLLGRRRSNTMTDYGENSMMFSESLYNSSIMLKKRIISLYVQLCELKSYSQLNKTGFGKVLKKFDKILDTELRSKYLRNNVDAAYPFKVDTIATVDGSVQKMVAAYAEVVTKGDQELAKKDLRSHLREHVVWERNTVWRELIGIERRAEAASVGRGLLGRGGGTGTGLLQGDEVKPLTARKVRTPLGPVPVPAWLASSSFVSLVVALAVFLVLLLTPLMAKTEQQRCLALLVFVSILWATEAIPLFVTSLLIPFLCVVLRVVLDENNRRLEAKEATVFVFSSMWTPVIMLLLGGFTLAAALSKCRIDKRLATLVLSKAGTSPNTVLLANMFVAAFSSMLISNVAAPVLCFGIIEPMLRTLPSGSSMSKAVIMGIALASNIGGMLSPIASPQNVVAMQNMSPEPGWGQWFFIVIPVGVVSILAIWALLLLAFRPGQGAPIHAIRPVKERFTGVQWLVSLVTVATIVLWCFSGQLAGVFGDMGVVAILPIVLFFGSGILTKEDFNNFPWTIIILAAGGLSLGKAVKSSGLLHTVAGIVTRDIKGLGQFGVLVTFSSLTLVIATFISHTVAALIVLPLVASVGRDMDDPKPNLLVMAGVLMCSAAMGLPTSGFPNMTAIMKEDSAGQRYLSVRHFIAAGVPSSLITLVVVITLGYGAMLIANID